MWQRSVSLTLLTDQRRGLRKGSKARLATLLNSYLSIMLGGKEHKEGMKWVTDRSSDGRRGGKEKLEKRKGGGTKATGWAQTYDTQKRGEGRTSRKGRRSPPVLSTLWLFPWSFAPGRKMRKEEKKAQKEGEHVRLSLRSLTAWNPVIAFVSAA